MIIKDLIDREMKRNRLILLVVGLVFGLVAEAQNNLKRYAYEGTLGGKVAIRLAFEVNADGIAAGSIYYPKAKNPAPILVVGRKDAGGTVFLREFQANGYVTGNMSFEIENGRIVGTWTNPKTGKGLEFTGMRSIAFPQGYGGKLVPESPDHIGKEYGYSFYNMNYQADMGGSVSFTAAGKNRVNFHVSNCPQNIAEGESEKGRPAVLSGNHFKYLNVNECGYGFEAFFFPQFVVLESVTEYETFHCFGMNASFEGVYIKVKE